MPVIGVIEPGARAGVAATRNRRIAVIATEGTVKGGAYARAIHRLMRDAVVVQQPCQVFVALAEEGWTDSPVDAGGGRSLSRPLFSGDAAPDTLVLGCTHFPVLADVDPQDHRRSRGAGRFGGDHGAGGGRALAERRLGSAPGSRSARRASSPPIRPSASPASARFSSDAPIDPQSVELVDLLAE